MSILQNIRPRGAKQPAAPPPPPQPGSPAPPQPGAKQAAGPPPVLPQREAIQPAAPHPAGSHAPTPPAGSPASQAKGKEGKRRQLIPKKYRKSILLTLFVFIPTIFLGFYLTFIFSPMYISESYFALRSNESSELPSVQSFLVSASSNTMMDAFIIQNHITSWDMLEKVLSSTDMFAHYADRSKDILSRLKQHPTREELLTYWQWLVSVTYELDKGIISVEVKAYSPEMAKNINDAILGFSEALVNQMNARAHQDAIRLAKDEVAGAERRVLEAQAALQHFRDDKSILDPSSTARGLEGVIASLEAEAASVQAELNAALEIMQQRSPRVVTLRTRLNALHTQIAQEKTRLAGINAQSTTLSSLVGDYTQLVTEEKFAQDQLVRSMGALEAARLKAIAKSRYIVPFQPPTLPEESLYPRPFLFTLFGFFALLILLGITSLVLAAIKDHMGV